MGGLQPGAPGEALLLQVREQRPREALTLLLLQQLQALLQVVRRQFLEVYQLHQAVEAPPLGRQGHPQPVAFDPRMFVEMKQNEIA